MTIQVEHCIVLKGSRMAESRHERWKGRRKIIAGIPAVVGRMCYRSVPLTLRFGTYPTGIFVTT